MTNETLIPVQTLNRVQTAKAVDVVESTIRGYERDFDIPVVRMPNGHCHHSVDSIPIMQAIKSMKKADIPPEDIKLNIAEELERVRARLQELPEAQGVDTKEVANEVAKQMSGEIAESGHQLVRAVLHTMQQEVGGLRQALGAAEAKVQLYESQAKQLPAKAESLRDAEEKVRWAQSAQARAESESQAAADEMLELRAQVRTFEHLDQQQKAQLVQVQLELNHSEARKNEVVAERDDLRSQLTAERRELIGKAGEIGSLNTELELLKRDLAEKAQLLEQVRQELEAERSKTWMQKLTKK